MRNHNLLENRTGYCNSCCTMTEYLSGPHYAKNILICNRCVDKEFDEISNDPTIIGSEAWLMEGVR